MYWLGMKHDIHLYVAKSEVCQKNKYMAVAPSGLLQPLPILDKVWGDLSMDFIGGLPKLAGINTIIVVINWMSKYAHFMGPKHPFTAQTGQGVFLGRDLAAWSSHIDYLRPS